MRPPERSANSNRWFVGAFSWSLALAAYFRLIVYASERGALENSFRWQIALVAGGAALALAGISLIRSRRSPAGRLVRLLDRGQDLLARHRWVSVILIALTIPWVPVALYGTSSWYPGGLFPNLLLFWTVTLILSAALAAWFPGTPWEQRVLAAAVSYGLLIRLLAYVPDVSTYPFSLGWSEASRYYYASLFHAKAIYGIPVSPSPLHPTRYLLQSIPFWIPGAPLWIHRLWQVVLWWGLPIAVGWALVRRYRLTGRWLRVIVAGWIVLYLFQGPMQYHLLVMVFLVVVGLDPQRPIRSTWFLLVASAWAGISRLNWYPVPAILGGCLYLIESEPPVRSWKDVARWPVLWLVLGSGVALASQAAYVRMTGLELGRFTSSLFSDLLVYRLLPNPTFFLGILPALILAGAPLGLSLLRSGRAWGPRLYGPSRLFVLVALGMLALGGLVVSLKIGGGSNLHNMDGFLILLLVVGFPLLLEQGGTELRRFQALPPFRELAFLVAVPIVFVLSVATPWVQRDRLGAIAELPDLQAAVQAASAQGERVLFISQRHLLTFGMISDVPLEPEYETVFLMEMAMSQNRDYLEQFTRELENHEFGLIVVGRLGTALQGNSMSFGEENDAWVTQVSKPILESYRLETCFDPIETCLYVPIDADGT